ncbi:class I SAM-dependent rRNA methyltransferase [Aerococcus sanguinicola]
MTIKMTVKLKQEAAQALRQGRPLLQADDFMEEVFFNEGDQVYLTDSKGDFLAMAYLAKQNKGLGWVYSYQRDQVLAPSFFKQIFSRAKAKRQDLFDDELTTAFRFFNGEGDGLGGLSVDVYGDYLLIQWYSLGIYAYRASIVEALKEVLPACRGIVGKNRFQSQDHLASEWLAGEEAPEHFTVLEEGRRYVVRLNDHWMTGIFLDQREVRTYLQSELAVGRRVLNTFSYTGAFSVAAALGGASQTCSVDLANRSRDLTEEQFAANGIPLADQEIYVMDTFDYYKYARRHDKFYDLIIMDPPSFARNKKKVFKVNKDYPKLVAEALGILSSQGDLVCSTNASNYSLAAFKSDIEKGAKKAQRSLRLIQEFKLPGDFPVPAHSPESDYLKVLIYRAD